MSQLLTWAEVDANIQSEMGNRCPDEAKRLEAINNEVRNINTVYDIETAIRKLAISAIPDGTVYNIATLIADNDFKKIADIYYDDDDYGIEYEWLEPDEFFSKDRVGWRQNYYTGYWEDGVMKLAINSIGAQAIATAFTMRYYSTFLGLNGSTFVNEVIADSNYKILLPNRFKDLVTLGAMKRLFWQSIGEDGNNQVSITGNRYKSELTKLGLDSVAKPIRREIRKVKIRPPTFWPMN